MEIHIDEMQSTVHATDSESILNPVLMRHIVQAVLAELAERQNSAQRWQHERCLAPGSSNQRREETQE